MSKHKKQKLLRRLKDKFHAPQGTKSISPLVHVAFLVLMIGGGIFYLVEVNATSTQGFQIRALEDQVYQLEEIQKELEFRQTDVSSLNALEERASDLQLVSVDRLETVDETGALASAR